MPIMIRMRESMPVILFGLLIAFLVTIVFEWGMDYLGIRGARADVIGEVNGKKISYKDFTETVRLMSENQKAQTGAEPDETQLKQLREQVWQSMVTQHLVDDEVSRLGLSVTDQELVEWVRGENPPEDLKRYFIDSTGQFRRDVYEQFLANPNQFLRDPKGVESEYGTRWLADYEKNLRQRRLQEKLQSIVLASVRVSDGEVRQRYLEQSSKFDAVFALFDPNALLKDEEVQLSDADLKSYYEENIEQYKFDAVRKLKYVMFPEKPSASDSAERKAEIEEAAAKAAGGTDFLQVSSMYADKPDSGVFFRHGELSPTLESAVFSGKVGAVVGPIMDNDGYHLFKVMQERRSDKEYIRARHILLPLEGEKDTNAVKALAQNVVQMARRGADFAQLAEQYSKDPGSAQQGGDLGWFTKGRMAAAFENAAFSARTGSIVGPVRTQFGLHIIKVEGRDARELKLASINLKIAPSSQTRNNVFERSRDFAYNARESDFSKEAQQLGLDVRETQVQEKGGIIPGVGMNESVTRWAFTNKVASVSEPFTMPNGYTVFTVSEIKDAGVRTFDEVKESLRPMALRKKKLEQAQRIAAELREKLAPGDSVWKVSHLNPAIKVQETGQFTLTGSVPGIGRDPAFLGTVAGLQVGQISQAIQGGRGAYLIQVLSKTDFDSSAFMSQKELLMTRLLQDKRNRFLSEWLAKLKENADIVDDRDMYFR